jgi:hypothetical protein
MNKIFWPVLLALSLSACGTTGGKEATVEDRTGATRQPRPSPRAAPRALPTALPA